MRGAGEDTERSEAGGEPSTRVVAEMGEVGGLGDLTSAFEGGYRKLRDPIRHDDEVGRL